MSRLPLRSHFLWALALTCAFAAVPGAVSAQNYTYLPSKPTDDGRMLSVAGGGLNTLGDNPLQFIIGVPSSATSFEIGIFDGETSGIWDQGTMPLEFTLYADPAGDGTGTTVVGEWHGDTMPNNAWFTITKNTDADASCLGSDFFYLLKVRGSEMATGLHWSSFKLRTTGTIVVRGNSNLAFAAPLANTLDLFAIYPSYPTLTPTGYDGTWRFFFDVPERIALSSVEVWDGDLDRGSYDCSDNDTDDPNTSNSIPSFATSFAVAEGVATSSIACSNAADGNTTANPPDNSANPIFRRGTGISYELISPSDVHYANDNPSGNLEWERFVLSTDPLDSALMDYNVPTIERGTWELNVSGVDLSNLNAFRFPYDLTGVDSSGNPVAPLHADYTNGSVTGLLYYENTNDQSQSGTEPGIPTVTILLKADFNSDGIIDTTYTAETDANGNFTFSGLSKGTYTVVVDETTLVAGTTPVWDSDSATVNLVGCSLTMCGRTADVTFGYKTPAPAVGTRTRGYWVNHPEDWPTSSLTLGGTTYSKTELLDILKRPTRGDQTYSLSAQLIAAKLNVVAGSESSCINATITSADTFLSAHPVGSRVRSDQTASSLTDTLDEYNNGHMCAGHMN